jgi:hypothetical protein
MNSRISLRVVSLLMLYVVFWGALVCLKPVHIDEANFLSLTTGSWTNPHNIKINWQGTTQRAFEVLSNPPGIAWWLWPVRNQPEWVMRLFMLPWAFFGLFGAYRIGSFYQHKYWPALVLSVCPIFVLSIGGLMPDMPLLACLLVGWGGYLESKNRRWLLLMGVSCLFRYNAVFFCFLFVVYEFIEDRDKIFSKTLLIFFPLLTLFGFDLWAYGEVHFLKMISFQSEQISFWDRFRQFPSLLAMLIGGAATPVLVFLGVCRNKGAFIFGSIVSALVVLFDDWTLLSALWNSVWVFVGVFLSVGIVSNISKPDHKRWVFLCLGGFAFLLSLRFSATRYWIPFLFPFLMLFINQTPLGLIKKGVVASFVLSGFLFYDDFRLSQAQKDAVDWANSITAPGYISGHWGFQYYAEKSNWVSSEDDKPIKPGSYWLRSSIAWPQEPAIDCKELIDKFIAPNPISFIPHIHRVSSRSNFHANALHSKNGPLSSYAPWGLGGEPYEHVELFKVCSGVD